MASRAGWFPSIESQKYAMPVGNEGKRTFHLLRILISLLPKYRLTFFVLDGFDETGRSLFDPPSRSTLLFVNVLEELLVQDYGSVSIAIFSRPMVKVLAPLLDLADVSVRLSSIEPDLQRYVAIKIERNIRPSMIAAGFESGHDLLDTIRQVLFEAADGL